MPKKLFTSENAIENGRKGGLKSAETRRMKRDLKLVARTLMEMPVRSGPLEDFESLEDAKGKNLMMIENMLIGQMIKGSKGDTRAVELCLKAADLMPDKNINVNAEVNETNDEVANILQQLVDYKKTSKYFKEDDE